MKKFASESIDLVVTSPPYADKRSYGQVNFSVDPDEYVDWFLPIAKEIHRVLKEDGSFVLNISDKVVNGQQHLYVFELVLRLVNDVGFRLVRDYIWFNPATPPNIFSTGRYGRTKKSHEYCFWFSKGDSWTFNLDPIRKPYSRDMQRFLKGRGKGGRKENTRPSSHSFDCRKPWTDNGGSDPGSVIIIGNTNSNDQFNKMCRERGIAHPARFPERLVEFFVLAGSNKNDIILDPFCGSGTVPVVAHRHNRYWIGIDVNSIYCELALSRIKMEFPDDFDDIPLVQVGSV